MEIALAKSDRLVLYLIKIQPVILVTSASNVCD